MPRLLRSPHTSYLPFPHYTAWGVLVLACMLAAPAVVHAQEAVPLTLNYHEDLEEEGTLPEGTEVLVYHEPGTRATPLSAWGSRQAIEDALVAKADEAFGEVFSRIGADGATDSVRVPTEPKEIAYVLARVPENGTENSRFYESQVGGEEVQSGPGLDLVVSGNMAMSPVSEQDTAWAASTFERAVKTPLTLVPDSISFSEDADVLVWTRSVEDSTAFRRDGLNHSDSTATTVTADGTIEDRFERTAYSGNAVYVLVRTTNAEGEPVLYESVWEEGKAGFGAVTDGTIQMQQVNQYNQATIAELFPEEGGQGWGWWWWGLTALIGVPLVVLLLLWVRNPTKKDKKGKRLRQKGRREQALKAVVPSSRDRSKPAEETLGQELIEGEADAASVSEESDAMATLRKENAALKKELQEKDEKLRSKNQTIQKLRKQSNGAARRQSQPKPRRPSTGEKVGKAFKKWCTEGSPAMVDRYQLFGRQIEDEIASASFRRIMRENNAAGLVFDDNAQDPVEYWLVEAKGTAYLLPQPTRNGFRELGECFDGSNLSPSQVRTVEPAKLKKRSSGFILEEKGRIE